MVIPFGSKKLCRIASFFFTFLLIDCIVSEQDFEDVFGTDFTRSPTQRPTFKPTVSPTSSPTVSPTVAPTKSPSASPSFFPTYLPTASPTRLPTVAPSEAPTIATMSLFPGMVFHTILEKDGISTEEIAQLFSDLLIDVVEEINSTYDYLYTRTALDVVVSTPDRGLENGAYRIDINGMIYYFDEVPTTEALAHSLSVYFSLWGSSNLENYLLSNGFEEAYVVSVDIGEESIDFYDRKNFGGQNIFINQEGELSKRNIVGFYILFVVAAITIVLVVYRIRLGRRRKLKRGEMISQRSSTESSASSSERHDDEDEESGIASQEQSNDSVGRKSTEMQQQRTTSPTIEVSIVATSKEPLNPDEKKRSPSNKKKKKSSKKKRKEKKSKKPKKSRDSKEIEKDGDIEESNEAESKEDDKPETEEEK